MVCNIKYFPIVTRTDFILLKYFCVVIEILIFQLNSSRILQWGQMCSIYFTLITSPHGKPMIITQAMKWMFKYDVSVTIHVNKFLRNIKTEKCIIYSNDLH